jgi:broad-specificity NMP kinase
MRSSPNVIITGTPGVGKTVHCEQLAQDTGLKHLSVNQIAKERDCFEEFDEERKSWVVDEDKVCRSLCFFYTSAKELLPALRAFLFPLTFFFSWWGVRGVVLSLSHCRVVAC